VIKFNFDNSFTSLPDVFFSKCLPQEIVKPELVILNYDLLSELGLNSHNSIEEEAARIFSGSQIPDGAEPLATAYAGHQFGYFVPLLGDGRAHLLGEFIDTGGRRWDLALKGSGRTRFSRDGDGQLHLGAAIREYLISEAMHYLGIPTTRSLAIVCTGRAVFRAEVLRGATLTRIASSHLRIGSFEYMAAREDLASLKALVNYALKRHFPDQKHEYSEAYTLLKGTIERQAITIAKWMEFGFIHGVMNTDNMTISGETLDYGPAAFMDVYDPATVFSSIDSQGRYAYHNQPKIALWNLTRLAEALLPLIAPNEREAIKLCEYELSRFAEQYHHHYFQAMGRKLGINSVTPEDIKLINNFLEILKTEQLDYTNSLYTVSNLINTDTYSDTSNLVSALQSWLSQWQFRRRQFRLESQAPQQVISSTPTIIPRNYYLEHVIEKACDNDYTEFKTFLNLIKTPYSKDPNHSHYYEPPPPMPHYKTYCGT
jgi:uncharacterized protein YdiU (UPF0061 family)